jgi:hypothetical protein
LKKKEKKIKNGKAFNATKRLMMSELRNVIQRPILVE